LRIEGEEQFTWVCGDELAIEVLVWGVWMDEYYCLLSSAIDCFKEWFERCVSEIVALMVGQQTKANCSQFFDSIIGFRDAISVNGFLEERRKLTKRSYTAAE
jgi:hypothetical protein